MKNLVQATIIVRKPYVVPYSEVIVTCSEGVCDNPYPAGVSYYSDGHGGGGAIQNGEADDDVDAKRFWNSPGREEFRWED